MTEAIAAQATSNPPNRTTNRAGDSNKKRQADTRSFSDLLDELKSALMVKKNPGLVKSAIAFVTKSNAIVVLPSTPDGRNFMEVAASVERGLGYAKSNASRQNDVDSLRKLQLLDIEILEIQKTMSVLAAKISHINGEKYKDIRNASVKQSFSELYPRLLADQSESDQSNESPKQPDPA